MTDAPSVWLAHLPTAVTSDEEAGACLSDAEREVAARFKFEADRARFVRARGLLRRLLGDWLGVPAADVAFQAGPHGRPVLAGQPAASGTHFNVSHSGDWALFGLLHERRIGVDLEVIKDVSDLMSIAMSNFTESEVEALRRVGDGGARIRLFYWLWTRKEACLKAIDLGIAGGLDRFEVLRPGVPFETPLHFELVAARRGDPCSLWVGAPAVHPEFLASVAFDGDLVVPEVRFLGQSMVSPVDQAGPHA